MSAFDGDSWRAEQRIRQLRHARRYTEAEQAARELVGSQPSAATPHLLLAETLLAMSRAPEALEHAETACRLEPEGHDALVLLTECRLKVGDRRGALASADQAVSVAPHAWTGHYTLARAHLAAPAVVGGKAALESINEALALAPTNPDVHNMKGIVLGRLDRDEDARQSYQRALELDPHHANALNNLGALDVRRRPVKAADRLTAAATLDPQSETFRANIGVAAGNILVRLMRRLMIAGIVITAIRIFGAPPWLMLVIVAATGVAFAVAVVRVTRFLPRGIRRSPQELWRALGPGARWYLKFSGVVVGLDLVIALAPVPAAVFAWLGMYAVILIMRAKAPRPGAS